MARPRSVSLPPQDMIALGEEMLDWVEENQPVHLCQFYSIYKGYTETQWRTLIQIPEFHPYYEKALKTIGIQYLLKDSNISDSIKQRWQRVYFKDLREEEDDTKKKDAEVRTQAENQLQDLLVKIIDYSASKKD